MDHQLNIKIVVLIILNIGDNLVVYNVKKWLCGVGDKVLFYCGICNVPYDTEKEADECEKSHKREGILNDSRAR